MRITKPRAGEPIRLVTTSSGATHYRAVVDTAARGEPRRQVQQTFPSIRQAREWVTETRA